MPDWYWAVSIVVVLFVGFLLWKAFREPEKKTAPQSYHEKIYNSEPRRSYYPGRSQGKSTAPCRATVTHIRENDEDDFVDGLLVGALMQQNNQPVLYEDRQVVSEPDPTPESSGSSFDCSSSDSSSSSDCSSDSSSDCGSSDSGGGDCGSSD